MNTTTNTNTPDEKRCTVKVTLTRAADLRLGDLVTLQTWDAQLELVRVTGLACEGNEDVEVTGEAETGRRVFSTSGNNTFQVSTLR